ATVALERSHGFIRIQRNYELATQFFRGMQVTDMIHVQHIKATIRERDFLVGLAPLFDAAPQLLASENLIVHGAGLSAFLRSEETFRSHPAIPVVKQWPCLASSLQYRQHN